MRISKTIEAILSNSQLARNSDQELIVAVLDHLGANLSVDQINIITSISFESIRRMRQKLQEQGKYMPSPEVAKRRRLKSYIVQQNAPQAKPERLQHLINEPKDLIIEEL